MIRALALLTFAACLLGSHTAQAKPKVALTQIDGDANGDVRDAVAEALEGKELSLITGREVNRAVDKIGDLADLTEKDFKKLATELEADAIVSGKLEKVGATKTLRFRLFVRKKMAKGFTVSFKDARSEKFRSMLHEKMLDKIGIAASGGGGDDEDEPVAKKDRKGKKGKASKAAEAADSEPDADAKPTKKGKLAKGGKAEPADAEDDTRPAKKKAKASESDADAEADADAKPSKKGKLAKGKAAEKADADDDARPAKAAASDDEPRAKKPADDDAKAADDDKLAGSDDDAPRKAKKKVARADDGTEIEARAEPAPASASARTVNRAAARVDLGASVLQRSFKFSTQTFANQPRNTSLSPVPGVRVAGEIYPLALAGMGGIASNVGLGFDYDKTLSLNLNARDPNNNMTFQVPAKQSSYSIGLRYRLVLGQSETSPSLTIGVGYGKRLFSTDTSKVTDAVALQAVLRDTPRSEYTVIDPGASFRLGITRMVGVSLGGRGLVITNAGPIQTAGSYGKTKVFGFQAGAGVDVVFATRFVVRVAGEFTQVGFTFMGGGQLSNGLDGNLMNQEVGGLADREIGGSATLGVVY
jgi:opacity protein-like surface antigen